MENEKNLEKEDMNAEANEEAAKIDEAEMQAPAAEEKTAEDVSVSPNDVMFGSEQSEPVPEKKSFFSTVWFKIVAAAAAFAIVIGGLGAAGVFNNLIEGYIKAPDEQLAAVFKRETELAKKDHKAQIASTEYPEEVAYGLDLGVRLSKTLLEGINDLGVADFDFTALEVLNNLGLGLSVGADSEQILVRLDVTEGDAKAGVAGVIDMTEDAMFLGVDFLTDALIKVDADMDIPTYEFTVSTPSEDDVDGLFGIYEDLIDVILANVGEVERERDTVDVDGKKVKCDLLKTNIDRERMASIITGVSEILEDESVKETLLAGEEFRSEQYDMFIGEIAGIDEEALPEDMDAEVSLWVHDGEVVGINIEEAVTDTAIYLMQLTGVAEINANVSGVSVKLGGQVKDGEGEFTLRVGDMKIGKIAVEYADSDEGVDTTLTVTLSDEVCNMAELYLEDTDIFGDLGEYAIVLGFDGGQFDYTAELSVMRGEEEMAYVSLDLSSDADIEPLDIEGRECYSEDQIEEWQATFEYSRIFGLPASLLKLIMQASSGLQ